MGSYSVEYRVVKWTLFKWLCCVGVVYFGQCFTNVERVTSAPRELVCWDIINEIVKGSFKRCFGILFRKF